MRLLGFDYGTTRIGVAVGDSLTGTARGLKTLQHKTPKFARDIDQLISEWQPEGFVIGWPLHADGSETPLGPAIRSFARQLQSQYGLPVHYSDERLSSIGARERFRERRGDPGLDAHAAAIILEGWLLENESNA